MTTVTTLPATAKADCFKDTYRTLDGELQIDFVCERTAGSKNWLIWARYGDQRITTHPGEFFNPGLKIKASSRDELLEKLGEWSEAVWKMVQPESLQADGGDHVRIGHEA